MLTKLAGPIIGALIGYCTNYIAVKMLFYLKQEVRIFGRKLPFTPGAIPKGKPRLPMLAICGSKEVKDMQISLDLLSENPNCKTILLPKANHDFPMRNAEELNKILAEIFSVHA